MAVKKTIKKSVTKEVASEEIEKEFLAVMATVKSKLSEKKFKHRMKKAVKILSHGLDKKKSSDVKVSKPKVTVEKKKESTPAKKATKKPVK